MTRLLLLLTIVLVSGASAQVRNLQPEQAAQYERFQQNFERMQQAEREWRARAFEAEQRDRWRVEDLRRQGLREWRPLNDAGDEE